MLHPTCGENRIRVISLRWNFTNEPRQHQQVINSCHHLQIRDLPVSELLFEYYLFGKCTTSYLAGTSCWQQCQSTRQRTESNNNMNEKRSQNFVPGYHPSGRKSPVGLACIEHPTQLCRALRPSIQMLRNFMLIRIKLSMRREATLLV